MKPTCLRVATTLAVVLTAAVAQAVPLTFTALTGVTGGSPAGTAVFAADLSGVGLSSILSITIADSNSGIGGAGGQWSGFDLDAIRLSTASCATASCAAAAPALALFDFSPAGTAFTPGTQRPAVAPKLFGTNGAGTAIDDAVATLGAFDGNSTTSVPGAFGFVSLGDGGLIRLTLTSPVSTSGLFLYIGEVGDNGEVAAGSITVSDRAGDPVPEPATLLLLGTGLGLLRLRRRRT